VSWRRKEGRVWKEKKGLSEINREHWEDRVLGGLFFFKI